MNFRTLILAATFATVLTARASAMVVTDGSNFTIDLFEDGSNVVAVGSGSIDTSSLTLGYGGMFSPFVNASGPGIYVGPPDTSWDDYSGASGPLNIGPGTTNIIATTGSGDFVGTDNNFIIVPVGYVSGTPLSSTATWNNQTLSSLGVTPGTYTWTWGDGDTFTLIAVPEPSQYGIFIFLAVAGGIAWRRFKIRPA